MKSTRCQINYTIWLWPFWETFGMNLLESVVPPRDTVVTRPSLLTPTLIVQPFLLSSVSLQWRQPADLWLSPSRWQTLTLLHFTLTHSCFLPCWPAVEGAIRVLLGDGGGCVWETERGGVKRGPGCIQHLAGQCHFCSCVWNCLIVNQKHNQLP